MRLSGLERSGKKRRFLCFLLSSASKVLLQSCCSKTGLRGEMPVSGPEKISRMHARKRFGAKRQKTEIPPLPPFLCFKGIASKLLL